MSRDRYAGGATIVYALETHKHTSSDWNDDRQELMLVSKWMT